MNTKFKASIEDAIEKAFNQAIEDDKSYWTGYIHPELVNQMATAAEQVFDSAMKVQEFVKSETE